MDEGSRRPAARRLSSAAGTSMRTSSEFRTAVIPQGRGAKLV
jgi:hypothetical protein